MVFVGETQRSHASEFVAKAVQESVTLALVPETVFLLGNVFTELGPPNEITCAKQRKELKRYYTGKSSSAQFMIRGHHDWNCDNFSNRNDFAQPLAKNYIIRINDRGQSRVVSNCDYGTQVRCSIEPAKLDDVIELVILDTIPWYFSATLVQQPRFRIRNNRNKTSLHSALRDSIAIQTQQQQALLESILSSPVRPPQGPPRILISHIPLESAGSHGLGGRIPSATYLNFPHWIQKAVQDGYFVGIVSGHEFSHLFSDDLSVSTKRSAKAWLKYPVFQVIVGHSGRPIQPWGKFESYFLYRTSISMIPNLRSNRSGFVKLSIQNGDIDIDFFELGTRHWYKHTFHLPSNRDAHPIETESPSMLPCLKCDPVQGAADGDQWTFRERLRY